MFWCKHKSVGQAQWAGVGSSQSAPDILNHLWPAFIKPDPWPVTPAHTLIPCRDFPQKARALLLAKNGLEVLISSFAHALEKAGAHEL